MQVFAYKMCNFLKKVFQCPLKLGDFSVFFLHISKIITNFAANLRRSRFYAAEGGGFFTY